MHLLEYQRAQPIIFHCHNIYLRVYYVHTQCFIHKSVIIVKTILYHHIIISLLFVSFLVPPKVQNRYLFVYYIYTYLFYIFIVKENQLIRLRCSNTSLFLIQYFIYLRTKYLDAREVKPGIIKMFLQYFFYY